MKRRSGEKPNKCNRCDVASSDVSNLRIHKGFIKTLLIITFVLGEAWSEIFRVFRNILMCCITSLNLVVRNDKKYDKIQTNTDTEYDGNGDDEVT